MGMYMYNSVHNKHTMYFRYVGGSALVRERCPKFRYP